MYYDCMHVWCAIFRIMKSYAHPCITQKFQWPWWIYSPPGPLCSNKTEDWPKWLLSFQQYCLASGVSEEGEECQVSIFLYCLGENTEDVLDTTYMYFWEQEVYIVKLLKSLTIILRCTRTWFMSTHGSIKEASCLMSLWNSLSQKYTG